MFTKPDEDLFESSRMSFGEHLGELRTTLFKAIIALAIGAAVGFAVGKQVVVFIQTPLQDGMRVFRIDQAKEELAEAMAERRAILPAELREGAAERDAKLLDEAEDRISQGYVPEVRRVDPRDLAETLRDLDVTVDLPESDADEPPPLLPLTTYTPLENDPSLRTIGTGMPDAFLVYVKASLVVGVVVASPAMFFFIWQFVASGLYQHERRYVWIFLPFSIGLFLLGAAVAFFFVFEYVLGFMFSFYAWLEIDPLPRIGEWLNLALLLPLGFGIGFQLPLVMLFLERIGVFTVQAYLQYWRIAVLVIFIASMILTPADPQSMLLLAIPLTFLYFGGVWLCRFMPRRKTPFGEKLP